MVAITAVVITAYGVAVTDCGHHYRAPITRPGRLQWLVSAMYWFRSASCHIRVISRSVRHVQRTAVKHDIYVLCHVNLLDCFSANY